ncbi:DUF4123 domain-containing protein [Enterobacter roggenkampii]
MDATRMIQTLPESNNASMFLLLEGGAQTTDAFQTFYNEHASAMHSLYLHPQLVEARNYGPWLFAIRDKEALETRIKSTPGLVAVIASSRSGGALAVQLSAACTIISPDGKAAVVRFYMHNVISLLAGCHDQEWHRFLFKEVAIKWSAAPDMTPQTVLYRRPVAQFSNFQPKIVSSWLILALFQANFLISGRSRLCPYQLVNSNQVRQGE